MERESRVKKTLLNVKVNTICYFVSLVVAFFTRKVFIDQLGADFIGLTSTLQSLLGFLNLAELGVGSAIGYVLYKPIFDGDKGKINEIISLLGYLYRCIGLVILGAGIILSCFLPLIFSNTGFSWSVIYLGFYSYLTTSLIGYFFNYRMSLLAADQRNYIVTGYFQLTNSVKVLVQMALALYLRSFIVYLLLEFLFGLVNTIILNRKISKRYPWLKSDIKLGRKLFKKYPEVGTYVKQIFFHKIGAFLNQRILPLLIYSYTSLVAVTMYSNYMILNTNINRLLDGIFGSSGASIGNLIAEKDSQRIYKTFKELFSIQFLVFALVSFCLWHLSSSFIALWLGNEFILSKFAVALICCSFFLNLMPILVLQFNHSSGLFADTWVPIARTCSIVIVIIGGYFWSLDGILATNQIIGILLLHIWKPYYLYSRGFKISVINYWRLFILNSIPVAIAFVTATFVCQVVNVTNAYSGWIAFIFEAVLFTLVITSVGFVLSYILSPDIRSFLHRFIKKSL